MESRCETTLRLTCSYCSILIDAALPREEEVRKIRVFVAT